METKIKIQVMKYKGKDAIVSLYGDIDPLMPKFVKLPDGKANLYRPGRKEMEDNGVIFIAPNTISDEAFQAAAKIAAKKMKHGRSWTYINDAVRECTVVID